MRHGKYENIILSYHQSKPDFRKYSAGSTKYSPGSTTKYSPGSTNTELYCLSTPCGFAMHIN